MKHGRTLYSTSALCFGGWSEVRDLWNRRCGRVFRAIPESRALLESAVREVEAVGRAKGVALPADLAGTLLKRIDGLPPGMLASMQKDIMEGRPSELNAQTGAVIRMGRALGIPTPTHEFIYASLLPMELLARGRRSKSP